MIYAFLAGLLLGGGVWGIWWLSRRKRPQRGRMRMPAHWPLSDRAVVNSREKLAWAWLSKVMPDLHILIKLPIPRFTMPDEPAEARHWYQLLHHVYCTFTVCDPDGRVIGCIDAPGPHGLSQSNQTLKHTLLSQCGIRYAVIDPENLPNLAQFRSDFLGPHPTPHRQEDPLKSRFKDVRETLQAAVAKQRSHHQKTGPGSPDSALGGAPDASAHDDPSGWEQNSFVTPLDSRSAELTR